MSDATTEQVLEKIGSFGWFQLRLFGIISYLIFFYTMVLMVMTFITAEPPWRCTANSTLCTLNGTFKAGDNDYEHRCSIPRKDWEFAVDGEFGSIVTEWDLVCDKGAHAALANSLIFLVGIFGTLVASILSDKYGRKKVVFSFNFIMCACGFLSAFAQTFWVYALFRSFAGIGIGACSSTAFTLVIEYVGTRHRSAVGVGIWWSWIFAMFVLALLGYLIQSWRILNIVTSAPGMLFILFWWHTPESLRWLLVKGKIDEARKTLQEAAKVNKRVISDDDMVSFGGNEGEERFGDLRDMFVSCSMTHRTLCSWYCWFVNGLVYYGISLSASTIGGNMYLNFFVAAVCEIISLAVGIPALNRFGRRNVIIAGLCLSSLFMFLTALLLFYDDDSKGFLAGKILSAMVLSKIFITISFDGIYVHSSELFPTVIRNTAMGFFSSADSIGSACASYVVHLLLRVHLLLPFGLLSATALISGILFITIPETNKKPMPDTVKQAVQIRRVNGVEVDEDQENTRFELTRTGSSESLDHPVTALIDNR